MAFVNQIQEFLNQNSINEKLKKKLFIQGSGISKSTVSKILNATQLNPDLKTILKIADYFNCSIDEVLKRKNNIPKKVNSNKLSLDEINCNLRIFVEKKLKEYNLNPYQLSKNCGFSADAIRHFIRENNPRKALGVLVIAALADYFKVSIDEILGRVPPLNQLLRKNTEEAKELPEKPES